MKTLTTFLFISILFLFGCKSITVNPEEDLAQTLAYLEQLELYQYDLIFEGRQGGVEDKALFSCLFDHTSEDTLVGTRFRFEVDSFLFAFNGEVLFEKLHEEKILLQDQTPSALTLNSNLAMYMSPNFLMNFIDEIINNPQTEVQIVGEENIGGTQTKKIKIILNEFLIRPYRDTIVTKGVQNIYELAIDEKTKAPVQFTVYFADGGFDKGTFTNLKVLENVDPDQWEITDVPMDFISMSWEEYWTIRRAKQEALVGKHAPDFILLDLEGKSFQLSKLIGQPVLLEFWFPNCGPCVAAVPEVNEIADLYKAKGLKVAAVEFSEVKEKYILDYIMKNGMETPTLVKGKEVAVNYGISGGPTFVLLNKKHEVVYVRLGLDMGGLIPMIEEVL